MTIKKFIKYLLIRFSIIFWKIFNIAFARIFNNLLTINRMAYWKVKLGYLGENTNIYPNVVIHSPECVKIGSNVSIAEFVHIWGGGDRDWE